MKTKTQSKQNKRKLEFSTTTDLSFKQAKEITQNYQMAYYLLAAQKLGISYRMLIPAMLIEFKYKKKIWRIHKSLTPINNSVAMTIASYKNTCITFLESQGLPVPKQSYIKNTKDVELFIKDSGSEKIVIKPVRGFGGLGVTILPSTKKEIQEAIELAKEKNLTRFKDRIIVENFIPGENYRLLVLDDEVIAATYRVAANVTGDGKNSIGELIQKNNKRKEEAGREIIPIDAETQKALEGQQLTLKSVVQEGQNVKLRFNANFCTGGTTRECLDEVDQYYLDLAVKAAQSLHLKLAGIDLITEDITNSKAAHVINEVNHDPGLRIHYMLDEGESDDVALNIQKYIRDSF